MDEEPQTSPEYDKGFEDGVQWASEGLSAVVFLKNWQIEQITYPKVRDLEYQKKQIEEQIEALQPAKRLPPLPVLPPVDKP